MSDATLQLGIPQGAYPERQEPRANWLDQMATRAANPLMRRLRTSRFHGEKFVQAVSGHASSVARLSAARIRETASRLRYQLRREGLKESIVAEVFALAREAASRTIGQRRFDVQ